MTHRKTGKNKAEDDPLWDRVKRTVTPLRKGSAKAEQSQSFEALMRVPPPEPGKKQSRAVPVALNQDRKVRRGKVEIDAKIDLHDLTRAQALPTFKKAIIRSYNQNKRCLLVVTGKGLRLEGVLRRSLPDWIKDPDIRPIIASYAPAHIRHGGSGAWYVFLKA